MDSGRRADESRQDAAGPAVAGASPARTLVDGLNSWCEIDTSALAHNASSLGRSLAAGCRLAVVVKGNAYGHGLELAAAAFRRAGADWLCVFDLDEAVALRRGGDRAPLLILGRVPDPRLDEAVALGCRLTVFDLEGARAAAAAGRRVGAEARLHVELETGNWRQGVRPEDAAALVAAIDASEGATLEGISTHFADVEDTTDHSYAQEQLAGLVAAAASLGSRPMVHCGNSAATLLWPHAHLSMVRVGVAAYGMWPSKETYISALEHGRPRVALRPALTWKARVVHLADAPAGAYVGYGRTYRTTHPSRLATLGVGYADGYDRHLSNCAHVLVGGVRAPVRGRVCMNLVMVDVTHVPRVRLGAEAVLLGAAASEPADDPPERVTAEQLAAWCGTINYEITTRIAARLPRVPMGAP